MFPGAVSVSPTALARRLPPCGGLGRPWSALGIPESCPLAWLDRGGGGACCASAALWWALAGVPAAGRPAEHLPLVGGGATLVDADVAIRLRVQRLYLAGARYVQYFVGPRRSVFLHRVIMHPPRGLEVHHAGSPLDNRRAQLRVISVPAHRLLEPKHRRAVSGWLGVYADRARWRAQITVDGRTRRLGGFATPYEAALARDDARARFSPGLEFVRNFPVTIPQARLRRCLLRLAGRSFRVVFRRRSDGAIRVMHCRLPLPLELAARPARIDLRRARLVTVLECETGDWRSIPLEGVLCLRRGDTWCRVVRPVGPAARRPETPTPVERVQPCPSL